MSVHPLRKNLRLLVINPNSSHEMTDSMSVDITMYTAPAESPPSINNDQDIKASEEVVMKNLQDTGILKDYDGALVACYSVHPLVGRIATAGHQGHRRFPVTGIFEASILATLPLLSREGRGTTSWGIVTTGKFWEDHLTAGIKDYLGQLGNHDNIWFSGVHSTGLDAADFHGDHVSPELVQRRLKEATTRLLLDNGPVHCVVMGCAGMAGLEDMVRSTIREVYPQSLAETVYVIDGVRAGIGILEQMVKNTRMFQDPRLPV